MKQKESKKVKRTGETGFFTAREVVQRGKADRRLDSFALLLEANMTCAAVAIIDNILYVTTNTIHATSKQEEQIGIQFLQKILLYFSTTQQSKQIDITTEVQILKYIFVSGWQSATKSSNQSSNNFTEDSLEKIIAFLLKNKTSVWRLKDINFFVAFLNSAIEKIYKAGRVEENKKEYDKISDDIVEIQKVFGFISPFVRHFKKVRAMLLKDEIQLKDYKILAVGKTGDHAEIRLMGYLLDAQIIKNLIESKEKSKLYIGISKLCCCYCIKTVAMINKSIKTIDSTNIVEVQFPENEILVEEEVHEHIIRTAERDQSSDPLTLQTAGTHGLSTNWEAPSYCKKMTYLDKGGKNSDSPSFIFSVSSRSWNLIEFQPLAVDFKFLEIFQKNFDAGMEELNELLEKIKQKKSKNMEDSIKQFFKQKISMLPERSSSSEEHVHIGELLSVSLLQELDVEVQHTLQEHVDDQLEDETIKRRKTDFSGE